MKSTPAKRKVSRIRRKPKANATREVTVKEVIQHLFDLFSRLGIEIPPKMADLVRATEELKDSSHPLYPHASAIGELLTYWHQDTEYLDDYGNPRPIKLLGRSPSFNSLAKRTVPNLNRKYLISELERLGAVTMDQNNLIRVHMRSFPAYEDKKLAIQHTLTTLDGFIRTLRHNLDSAPSNSEQFFHRIASRSDFDSTEIPALKVRVKRHGQTFLESLDNWLIRKSLSPPQKSNRGKRPANVAIGVYLSVDSKQ